jgi:hypothetical protein
VSPGGDAVFCPCGNRVVVPPPEELQSRPVVLSAMTVERRIRRLLTAGELPPRGACASCGQACDGTLNLWLDCERSRTRTSGGPGWLFIPFFWGLFFLRWEEERRVEVLGHDTVVPAPLASCPGCADALRAPSAAPALGAAAAAVALGVLACFYSLLVGAGVGLVGLAAAFWLRRRQVSRWQRHLKGLLRQVPAYCQLLGLHPAATAVIRVESKASKWGH